LTGRPIAPENAHVDEEGRFAVQDVDGAAFRPLLRGGKARVLVLLRPCAFYIADHFEGPEITDQADLDYALLSSAWQPLHEHHDTGENDPSEDLAES
jgi:hypothetical protein